MPSWREIKGNGASCPVCAQMMRAGRKGKSSVALRVDHLQPFRPVEVDALSLIIHHCPVSPLYLTLVGRKFCRHECLSGMRAETVKSDVGMRGYKIMNGGHLLLDASSLGYCHSKATRANVTSIGRTMSMCKFSQFNFNSVRSCQLSESSHLCAALRSDTLLFAHSPSVSRLTLIIP